LEGRPALSPGGGERNRSADGGTYSTEGVHKLFGGEAGGGGLGEDLADVGEERGRRAWSVDRGAWSVGLRSVGLRGGQMVEGVEGALGPVAAGHLGDGEERTPVVGETVEGGGGQGG